MGTKISVLAQNKLPIWKRLWIYQAERFPLFGHGLMIMAFTFSAVSYSRIGREAEGFISLKDFMIGAFISMSLFLLLRISDEFKDKEDDEKYRSYLPVPRGLVSLKELKVIAVLTIALQFGVLLAYQVEMLPLYLLVLLYLGLMRVEFFVPEWLKQRQLLYVTSHMFIIPLIDIYASGLDWKLGAFDAHLGLAWFFALSYSNGLVLELGRKLRSKEQEEEGVVSYTGLLGRDRAVRIWMLLLFVTMMLTLAAANYAQLDTWLMAVFVLFFIVAMVPALSFLKTKEAKWTKRIEYSSVLWTILMYAGIGALPMIQQLLN